MVNARFTHGAARRYPALIGPRALRPRSGSPSSSDENETPIALLSDALDLPKPFGPYTLLRRLAVGGMAEVYVAKTKGIGGFEKLVAIKVIHPRFSEDEHFVQMLVEEAKISVQLNHVNIAQTFDLGCIDDTYYISMEYVEGADGFRVEKRARDKKIAIPVDICCYIAAEICNGLGYAHRKRDADGSPLGIVHRDISPQNVLVSFSGEVKIVDFGIAKAALRGGQTEVGVIKGKYYYMSPEQAWGDPVDQRTDVFATGLLLHELLTGEMVYQEDNVPALLDRVRKAEIPSPRARRRDVPEELAAVIMKAVAKDASDRFQSAHAFGQELTRLLYQINPTFTASRMAQLMGTLFPEDVRRHSQILKLPPAEQAPVVAPTPSEERELERMSREQFAPSAAEPSVIFDLDEVEEMTRNDILPFRKKGQAKGEGRVADRPTKQLRSPRAHEDDTTAQLPGEKIAAAARARPRDEWDEETLLKDDKQGWDDSTLVNDGGDAMNELLQFVAARRSAPSDDDLTTDLAAEKTVAMASFPAPPVPLPPRPVPPPRKPPPPPPPPASELLPEKTVAFASHEELSAEPTVALGPEPSEPPELPAEKTVALGAGSPPPAPSRKGAMAGPSNAGIRLGPEADRFFTQSSPEMPAVAPPSPFDPLGGTPQPAFGSPPGRDPFVAQPPPATVEALGKPEPRRWILAAVLGVAVLVGLGTLGTWLAARPGPTTLVLDSSPSGASVEIDGHAAPSATPVTLEDLQPGRTVHVAIEMPGYETRTEDITLGQGENRNIFVLNPVRVTLRVETRPAGAQVWVDNVLCGSAPLEIPNLSPGTTARVRTWTPGHETVTQDVALTESERHPRVVLTLPPAAP